MKELMVEGTDLYVFKRKNILAGVFFVCHEVSSESISFLADQFVTFKSMCLEHNATPEVALFLFPKFIEPPSILDLAEALFCYTDRTLLIETDKESSLIFGNLFGSMLEMLGVIEVGDGIDRHICRVRIHEA